MSVRHRLVGVPWVCVAVCLALVCVLAELIFARPGHAEEVPFPRFVDVNPTDEPNHGPDVEWLAIQGITSGWPSEGGGAEFRGKLKIARCDMAAFLYRMADLCDDGARNESIALSSDEASARLALVSDCTESTPHAYEIAWLVSSEITRGWSNSDGTFQFRPYATVARQDMAAFLYRLVDFLDGKDYVPVRGADPLEFVDVFPTDMSSHSQEVAWLASWGISKGWVTPDGTYEFRGMAPVARQDMAAFLHRLYDVVSGGGASQIIEIDPPTGTGTLTVHFIDVGQGDSEFIELPDGRSILVDAGVASAGPRVVEYVRSLGYGTIDYVVATHPHADHIGGMPAIFAAFDVGGVWAPRATANTMTYEAFLDAVVEEGTGIEPAYAGESICDDADGCSVAILGPIDGYEYSGDLNSSSVILLIEYEGVSFLLVGDAPADRALAAWSSPIDVLKVGHHGSYTATNYDLAAALTPRYAVVSYGAGNSYGHPHARALEALQSMGTTIYGTAANGTITAAVEDSNLVVTCEREGTMAAGGA